MVFAVLLIPTYSLQSNELAKPKNRKMLDEFRPIWKTTGLNEPYWGEAVAYARCLQKGILKPWQTWRPLRTAAEKRQIIGTKEYLKIQFMFTFTQLLAERGCQITLVQEYVLEQKACYFVYAYLQRANSLKHIMLPSLGTYNPFVII